MNISFDARTTRKQRDGILFDVVCSLYVQEYGLKELLKIYKKRNIKVENVKEEDN